MVKKGVGRDFRSFSVLVLRQVSKTDGITLFYQVR